MCCSFSNNYKYVKCCFITIIVLMLSSCLYVAKPKSFAYATEDASLQDKLEQSIQDTLENLDLSELEEYFNQNSDTFFQVFGYSEYLQFLKALISGDLLTDFNSVFKAITNNIKQNISSFVSPLLLVLVIVLVAVVFKNIRPQISSSSVQEATFFICFAVIVSIIVYLFGGVYNSVKQTLTNMQSQMDAILPVLLLLMNGAGAGVSVKAYKPLVLLLSGGISNIFFKVLLPMVIVVFVLNLVGNISPKTKVKNLTEFFNSLFKWVIGIVFTVYMGFMSIQGITASSADGISIKTAKYAIKNYIPMLGGYISDGFEVVRVGSNIIKNAVGFSGIIFLLIAILSPIILIAVLQLSLKLVSGLIEPLSDDRTSTLLSSASKSLSMLTTVVLGVSIMYFIFIFLLMCSVSGVV